MRALVVIPSFNEEDALPAVLADVARATQLLAPRHELTTLVIDDGSRDQTAAVARQHGARVLRLCSNLGIGGAVQAGLRVALREGFDCALQLDGDGQHRAEDLGLLLAGLEGSGPGGLDGSAAGGQGGADLVVGSRYVDRVGFQSTTLRRAGKGFLSRVLRAATGLRLSDPTSGFRGFGRRSLLVFDRVFPYDFPEPESLSLAHAFALRVLEVPVTMRERKSGQSSIRGLTTAWYMLKVTAAIVLDLLRARRLALTEEQTWNRSPGTGSLPSSASASSSPSSASSRGSA